MSSEFCNALSFWRIRVVGFSFNGIQVPTCVSSFLFVFKRLQQDPITSRRDELDLVAQAAATIETI